MSFNENYFMGIAATSLINGNNIKLALEDVLIGDPRPSAIEHTLSKYCSSQLTWANHEGTFGLLDLIPHIRSWRLQMVQVRVDITHLVTQGNTTANRHMTYFTRKDGTGCEIECFQFIISGEDGMWLRRHVAEHLRELHNCSKRSIPQLKHSRGPQTETTSDGEEGIVAR
ncbi:hypothetical protein Slin14017_G098100 [Septoria linicola]|nr:hypothetical protein Slin14017_G098100 [Septoria linicola]